MHSFLAKYNITNEDTSLKRIFIISLLLLAIAHLANNEVFGQTVSLAVIPILFLTVVVAYIYNNKKIYLIILILFVCNHFLFALNYGGLFNIITFLFGVFYYVDKKKNAEIHNSNNNINLYLLILILFNILGWSTRFDVPPLDKIFGVISFFGYLLIFRIISKLYLSENRLKSLVILISILAIYSGLMVLNSFFGLLDLPTPLLNTSDYFAAETGSKIVTNMFGISEISGEYGLSLLFFLLVFTLSKITNKVLKLKQKLLLVAIIASLITALLSFSKSIFILLFVGLIITLLFTYSGIRAINKKSNFLIFVAIIFAFILVSYSIFDLTFIFQRFEQYRFLDRIQSIGVADLLRGEGVNRDYAFGFAFDRFGDDSWFIGYGWGTRAANKIAWFGTPDFFRLDFHSLYLALPMLYGWIGSFAFLMIIISTIFQLAKIILKGKNNNSYLILASSAFLIYFVLVLSNQYKISMLSFPNYHILFWMMLGFANSLINTYYYVEKEGSRN